MKYRTVRQWIAMNIYEPAGEETARAGMTVAEARQDLAEARAEVKVREQMALEAADQVSALYDRKEQAVVLVRELKERCASLEAEAARLEHQLEIARAERADALAVFADEEYRDICDRACVQAEEVLSRIRKEASRDAENLEAAKDLVNGLKQEIEKAETVMNTQYREWMDAVDRVTDTERKQDRAMQAMKKSRENEISAREILEGWYAELTGNLIQEDELEPFVKHSWLVQLLA